MLSFFKSNTFNFYKLFLPWECFTHSEPERLTALNPRRLLTMKITPTHTHTKLLKLSLGCQFIHKCCKLSGRHIWRKGTSVLTHRWRQKASLGLHRSEYSAQWSFTYKLSTNEPFILKYLLTTKNWHSPKAMRQIQKGLTCGNHMTAPC